MAANTVTVYNPTDVAIVVRDDGRVVPRRERYTGGSTPQIDAAVARGDLVIVKPSTSTTSTSSTTKE